MNRSMLTASVTMAQLQKKIDTIGHNLANSNTNGYKVEKQTLMIFYSSKLIINQMQMKRLVVVRQMAFAKAQGLNSLKQIYGWNKAVLNQQIARWTWL
ncbi:flagellar basal body rod protein [Schinkia azotoformans MEV2011]|uniref:Flagellar basal body rod protein n=1 Tax=Schinkia azotoformans MEV2011 TaxID=1348973 RepID=A0A072NLT9_SCHAZ|nr:flagellar basal body rod protein [Schinkia azotoformans MEV2011]